MLLSELLGKLARDVPILGGGHQVGVEMLSGNVLGT